MNLKQIKADCIKKMARAMNATEKNADVILDESFNQYYRGGTPQPNGYSRTYTLHGAKKIISSKSSGTSMSMEAGYDSDQISYSTGSFSGAEVFGATATGTYGVVGDPSYDEDAFEKILDAAEENFSKQFG